MPAVIVGSPPDHAVIWSSSRFAPAVAAGVGLVVFLVVAVVSSWTGAPDASAVEAP